MSQGPFVVPTAQVAALYADLVKQVAWIMIRATGSLEASDRHWRNVAMALRSLSTSLEGARLSATVVAELKVALLRDMPDAPSSTAALGETAANGAYAIGRRACEHLEALVDRDVDWNVLNDALTAVGAIHAAFMLAQSAP